MLKASRTSAVAYLMVALSACSASLSRDAQEIVMVNAVDCPAGIACVLTNKKGTWSVEPPGLVRVQKSDDALTVHCRGPDGATATGAMASEMTGSTFDNFLGGGLAGVIIDAYTDAHWNYANNLTVTCGRDP